MKYLRIKNDTLFYPYSLNDLKSEYFNTSFPEIITEEFLNSFNVFSVIAIGQQNDYTKNYTESVPVLIDNKYYETWIITDASQEEIQQRLNTKWSEIRSIRKQYLSDSDWSVLLDSPLSESKKQEWITYRQLLRDITTQPDPFNIVWPTKPQ